MSHAKNMHYDYDLIIAGGGMVGLTLALMLAKELPEHNVLVVDPALAKVKDNKRQQHDATEGAAHDSFDSRSTALSAGSVEMFQALGIWSHLKNYATPIQAVDVSDKGHVGRNHFRQEDNSPLGFVVENRAIGCALKTCIGFIDTITLEKDKTVNGLSIKQKGAIVSLQSMSSDEVVECSTQCLIVADGAQSGLRKKLGIDTQEKNYQQYALIANLLHTKPHNGVAYERFTTDGPVALLPRGNSVKAKQSALVWTRSPNQLDDTLAMSEADFLAKIEERFGYRLGQFTQVGKREYYPLHLILAREQVRQSLVMMGNAAHFLHPIAGQGFNLSARDCAQLVATLAAAARGKRTFGDLTVLQTYIDSQIKDQYSTAMLSNQFNDVFSAESKIVQAGRNLGLEALQNMPSIQKHFYRRMMGRGQARPHLNFMREYLSGRKFQTKSPVIFVRQEKIVSGCEQ